MEKIEFYLSLADEVKFSFDASFTNDLERSTTFNITAEIAYFLVSLPQRFDQKKISIDFTKMYSVFFRQPQLLQI